MAYEIQSETNILKYNYQYVTAAATITNNGVSANTDGRKIIPAGTPVASDETNKTFRKDYAKVKVGSTASAIEGLTFNDVDVTDGDKPVAILLSGYVNGPKLAGTLPNGTTAILKAFGIHIIGTYTEATT